MVNNGFIELYSLEDPLSKAFVVLGLYPLAVRLRRDNDVGISMAEFFDGLGNGLYLDTDLDDYEKKNRCFEDSTSLDFNSLIMNECNSGNFKKAMRFVDEMILWGQELSISVFSAFLKGLGKSHSQSKAGASLFETNAQDMLKEALELFEGILVSYPQLKLEVHHIFLENLCITGFTSIAHVMVEELLRQGCILDHVAYSHLIRGLCDEKKFSGAIGVLGTMLAKDLVPCLDVSLTLIPHLCRADKFEEAITFANISWGEKSAFLSVQSALLKMILYEKEAWRSRTSILRDVINWSASRC
ncbi:hypothetical protein REPUB_Repub10bG0050800 [Reevesia pubescens]